MESEKTAGNAKAMRGKVSFVAGNAAYVFIPAGECHACLAKGEEVIIYKLATRSEGLPAHSGFGKQQGQAGGQESFSQSNSSPSQAKPKEEMK